jgi:hypothetical protein
MFISLLPIETVKKSTNTPAIPIYTYKTLSKLDSEKDVIVITTGETEKVLTQADLMANFSQNSPQITYATYKLPILDSEASFFG